MKHIPMEMEHFTRKEKEQIKEEMRKRRTPETLVEGKWSINPFNRDPEILGKFGPPKYPETVVIRDITLRTIEQTPGVAINNTERQRLAAALIEAGVQSIMPAILLWEGFDAAKEEVRFIKNLNSSIEVVISTGTNREDIDRAVDLGADTVQITTSSVPAFNVIYEYAPSILRAAWRGEDWRKTVKPPRTDEEHLTKLQEVAKYAKDKGLRVEIMMGLLFWITLEYYDKCCRSMAEVGVEGIALGDGSSTFGPEAFAYFVSHTKEVAPKMRVTLHPHNAFGTAMAKALAAIHVGAETLEVSINGLCSGVGQLDLAEAVAALEYHYGVKTGIKMEMLTSLRRLVEDITRVRMAQNKPVTGERAWVYSEEMIVKEGEFGFIHKCVNPAIFGNVGPFELGRHSGPWTLLGKLREIGLSVAKDQVPIILNKVKEEMQIRKRALTQDDIKEIVERITKAG